MSPSTKGRAKPLSHWFSALFTLTLSLALAIPLAAQEKITVEGRVLDEYSGKGIAAANVHVGMIQTMTDAQGRFQLVDVPEGSELHVERLGYKPLILTAAESMYDLKLAPAPVLLESMVVQALGDAMLAHNSSLAVTNIDKTQISSSGLTSLAEAMDGSEGVSVSRVGSWGSRLSLRGLSGERLAVMIDGMRVSRACTYGMDMGLATIDPATVERVEVLSGPGSTAYGSGNVGGVINVVTRRPNSDRPVSGEVRAQGSSAVPGGGLGGSLSVSGDRYAVGANVDASSFGDYRTPEGTVGTSGYRQISADVKADFEPTRAQRVTVGGQYYGGRDIGWPMRGGASIPEETRTNVSLGYGWQPGGELLDGVSANAYFQNLDHHMVMTMQMTSPTGMPMTSTTDGLSYSQTAGGRAQMRLTPADRLRLEVGTEATNVHAEGTRWLERIMGSMAPTQETFHTWPGVDILDLGAFVQGDLEITKEVSLTGGIRLDRVDRQADVGDQKLEWVTTGNVGLRSQLNSWLSARATVGVGYRTPDPMELYGLGLKPDGFLYRGNANLATEKSLNSELTLTAASGATVTSVTGFTNRINDMVLPTFAGDSVSNRPVREYQNLGEARISGVSGSFQTSLPSDFSVSSQATWTYGEDPRDGSALPTIPPLEGGLALRRAFGESFKFVETEWRGAFRQSRVAESIGEIETPGWHVFDVRAGAELAGTELTFGVENVFDELYRAHLDPYTLYRPGRNFFIRMSRSF
ncbi:MAG: TonB-dependent receptor [Gemmatimonadota bacterium]|jgi:iron complex outermembrane receptor protein